MFTLVHTFVVFIYYSLFPIVLESLPLRSLVYERLKSLSLVL
jgi:hypothetical protein